MQNQIVGISVVILCTILYFFSFRSLKKKNYKLSIALIVLAGFILRMYCACDFFLHEWDERFHALVAKNLIDFPFKPMLYIDPLLEYDYRNWAGNHVWVHKQPFPLYSMAMSMWLFGKNVIALRLPSILICTSSIYSTYKIGELLYNKKIAIVAAFLFSINGLIVEQTAGRVATDHFDIFFLSLISWAVYFVLKYVKNKSKITLILGASVTGLAILTKWLPALIVIPIWLIAAYGKSNWKMLFKDIALFLFVVLCIVLPWQLYILSEFPLEAKWEYLYNKKHIFEVLGPHGHSSLYHFGRMRIIFGELIYIPLLWFIYKFVKNKTSSNQLILLIWILIPYLFFTIAKTKMQGYILFSAPAMFIVIAVFIESFKEHKGKWRYLIKGICLLLLLLPIRYSIERIKPFSDRERSMPWITELRELDKQYLDTRKVIFNCKYPIQTMFYSSFSAYETIPEIDKLIELNEKKVTVFIDNWEESDDRYRELYFVKFIDLSTSKE